MKRPIWDILSLALLGATLMFCLFSVIIFANPQTAINPFKPPVGPTLMKLPTATETWLPFPPTWTPTANPFGVSQPTQANIETLIPTETLAALGTPTPMVTATPTATLTPTRAPTRARTVRPTETHTPTPRPSM